MTNSGSYDILKQKKKVCFFMKAYHYPSYNVTVKAGGSTAVFCCGTKVSLTALSDAICSAFGVVKDRACFFFTGTEPWDGEVFSDSLELPSELSTDKNQLGRSLAEKGVFLYQLGYDADVLFVCTPAGTDTAETGISLVTPPDYRASQFPAADEMTGSEEEEEEEEDEIDLSSLAEHSYTETELRIDRYLHAAVALYGIVERKKMISLLTDYEPSLTQSEIEKAFEVLPPPDGKGDYTFVEKEILYTELAEFQTGEYFLLKQAQKGKKFRNLSKNEFLKFSDSLYIEPESELKALEKSLEEVVPDPGPAAESVCRMLEGYIPPEEAVSLEEKILKTEFAPERKKSVLIAAEKLYEALPRRENRGFSTDAMRSRKKPGGPVSAG